MPRLDLTCACNGVAWSISETTPRSGIRYICHCDDCQAYLMFLGRADDVLDANGGMDAYQLPASAVRLARGQDLLACVQVTARPLLRWYCTRCRTPVAGTYNTAKLSFISLTVPRTAQADAVLGPSSGHVWTRFGRGDLSRVRQVNIPAMLWRMASRIVAARLTGDYRSNPFFDPATSRPIARPRRLTAGERADLDRKVRLAAARGALRPEIGEAGAGRP